MKEGFFLLPQAERTSVFKQIYSLYCSFQCCNYNKNRSVKEKNRITVTNMKSLIWFPLTFSFEDCKIGLSW